MHFWDWIVLAAVAAAVAAAVFFAVRRRKKGCSCGCSDCAYSGRCGGRKAKNGS